MQPSNYYSYHLGIWSQSPQKATAPEGQWPQPIGWTSSRHYFHPLHPVPYCRRYSTHWPHNQPSKATRWQNLPFPQPKAGMSFCYWNWLQPKWLTSRTRLEHGCWRKKHMAQPTRLKSRQSIYSLVCNDKQPPMKGWTPKTCSSWYLLQSHVQIQTVPCIRVLFLHRKWTPRPDLLP